MPGSAAVPPPPPRRPIAAGAAVPSAAGPAPAEADLAPPQDAGRNWLLWILVGVVGLQIALIAGVVVLRIRPIIALWQDHLLEQRQAQLVEKLRTASGKDAQHAVAVQLHRLGADAVLEGLDATVSVSLEEHKLTLPPTLVQAFAEIGPPLVDDMLQGLATRRENLRVASAAILREMGETATVAAEPLASLVADRNPWVRWYACDALGNCQAAAAVAVPALQKALQHEDPFTRRRALLALGRFAEAAASLTSVVRGIQADDPRQDVRDAATQALYQIDLPNMTAQSLTHAGQDVRILAEQLASDDAHVSVNAARTLAQMGPAARDAVPALALALRSNNKWLREAACQALGAAGAEARIVLPALYRAADDSAAEVRDAAEKAVPKVQGEEPAR